MTDPLSLAASLAGLLSLTGAIVSNCYRYGCAVRDAPLEIQSLVNELTAVAGVLVGVRGLVVGWGRRVRRGRTTIRRPRTEMVEAAEVGTTEEEEKWRC